LFSIVMPVWNRADLVAKAIESVLEQSFKEYELLIIDDGSDDNLKEAIGPYLDDRILYYRITHSGVSAARNYALTKARFPFIAYLDSDNRWMPDFLATMYAALNSGQATFHAAYCRANCYTKDHITGEIEHEGTVGDTFSFRRLLAANYIDLNTFVHSKSVINWAGKFDEGLKRLVDWDFIIRVTSLYEPAFVPEVLVEYNFAVADNAISLIENLESADLVVRRKHESLNRPVEFIHDAIGYTWQGLSDKKYDNWIRMSNQNQKLNTDDYTTWGYPWMLQIEPTNACNLQCPLCPVGRKELGRKTRHMTFQEYKSIVDNMADYLLFLVLWDWGEPFMNPELPKMIAYATERGIRTVTSTNAHFLNNDVYLKAILTSGLSTLIIAVDSVCDESYRVYRKKGSLDKVMLGLNKVIEMKKRLGSQTLINMRMVVMRQNEHEVGNLLRLARKVGADWFTVKSLNPSCGASAMDDELLPENPRYRRFEYREGTNERIRIDTRCPRPWVMSNILSNGDVVVCCYDYDAEMTVGNALEKPFTEIWNSAPYRALRKKIYCDRESIAKCRDCWISFKLSESGWFPESYDLRPITLSRLKNKIRNRLRKTPIWPLLRFGKRTVLSGLNWIKRNERIIYLRNYLRINTGQFLKSQTRTLQFPLQQDSVGGWKAYGIFDGPTRNLDKLSCHVSVLSARKTPHQPHKHTEEEILIMLSGKAELVTGEAKQGDTEKRHSIRPGSFVYYPAGHRHTIHNPGPKSATYLMFKWLSEHNNNNDTLDMQIVQLPQMQKPYPHQDKNGYATARLIDAGTKYLHKLHCHITTLEPGSGYPPHADTYDVAIVVLGGRIKTLGEEIGANGVVFYAAGEAHGLKNVGSLPAVYLVFEFHGRYSSLRG